MTDLYTNETFKLTSLPSAKQTVGCRQIYTIIPNGQIECLKARLVAKGYTQTYDVDYFETFSLVARLHYFVRILLSVQW